jgi:hypothetical protein
VAATTRRNQGKTQFVQEFLHDNPYGNVRAVNEAWKANRMRGTISGTLVNKMRSQLGLAGNLRDRPRTEVETTPTAASATPASTGKKRGRRLKQTTADRTKSSVRVETRGRKGARSQALEDLESEIDRILFKVMGMGGLTQIEDALRQTRRLLYNGFVS